MTGVNRLCEPWLWCIIIGMKITAKSRQQHNDPINLAKAKILIFSTVASPQSFAWQLALAWYPVQIQTSERPQVMLLPAIAIMSAPYTNPHGKIPQFTKQQGFTKTINRKHFCVSGQAIAKSASLLSLN